MACASMGRWAWTDASAARRAVRGLPLADGQVGGGVAELALIGREGGKGFHDGAGQDAKWPGVAWGEPEHLVAEPGGAVELEAEPADGREQALKPGECRRADCLGRHERGEHRDVGWYAELCTGVEAFPMPGHCGFGFRDLHHEAALRAWVCHAGDVNLVKAGAATCTRQRARTE
jgi:hypothetical protein